MRISGISLAYLGQSLGVSQVYLQVCLKHSSGVSQGYLRRISLNGISGVSQVYLRHFSGKSLVYTPCKAQANFKQISGICQGILMQISCKSQSNLRLVSGIHQKISGISYIYHVHISGISHIYLVHISQKNGRHI